MSGSEQAAPPSPDTPAVAITGASSGIGRACAETFASGGFHVFAGVRKGEDAAELRAALGDAVTPLRIDVTDDASLAAAADQVRDAMGGRTLAGLVNNAGVPSAGPLLHTPIAEMERVLGVNLVGVLRATQAFAPQLGADRSLDGPPGRIVMMSSQAGKIGYPFGGVYSAAKHGLEGLSEALRRELMIYPIDVIIIGPGAVATPIWDRASELDMSPYKGTDYEAIMSGEAGRFVNEGRSGLPPEDIAAVVLRAVTTLSPRVRYAIAKKPLRNWILPRCLPKRFVDRIIARIVGLTPPKG